MTWTPDGTQGRFRCQTHPVGSFDLKPWQPPFQVTAGTCLFHYTPAAGLLGILETGTLWATEASGLNDAAEITLGQQKVRELIDELPRTELQSEMRFAVEQVLDANGPDASDVFVLAASMQQDDANQWRLYADEGRGYCVELDSAVPLTVLARGKPPRVRAPSSSRTKLRITFTDTGYVSTWSRALYDEETTREAFLNLATWADRARADAEQSEWPDPDSGDPSPSQQFGYHLSRAIASLTRCVKAPGFSGETEARVLVSFLVGDVHAHARATPRGIVRHFSMGQGTSDGKAVTFTGKQRKRLPIKTVTLGPGLRFELAAPAIRSLLDRHGYEKVKVLKSHVQLR